MVTSCEWLEELALKESREEHGYPWSWRHHNRWFPWGLAALGLLFGDPGENLLYIELYIELVSLPELLSFG